MTAAKHTKLASRYANLSGASLLEAIADDPKDAAILEAVWRLREPITASQAVGPILKTGAPHLVELVLNEILAPTLDNPLRTQLVTALGERRPALPKGRAVELAERLRNPEPLHGYYEPYRSLFEMWALEQDGKVGEDFAIDVISGATPQAANGTVRESAYQRCRSSTRVMNAAGEALTTKLGETLSQQTWTDAVEFIEKACRNTASTPKAALPVLRRLVELAPRFGQQEPFTPEFERLVVIDTLDELESSLGGGALPETPGSRSLIRLIAKVPRAPTRAALFGTSLTRSSLSASCLGPYRLRSASSTTFRRRR